MNFLSILFLFAVSFSYSQENKKAIASVQEDFYINGSPKKMALMQPREPDGTGSIQIIGEQKQWHKITLVLDGPFAHEQDNTPNPFLDYRMNVTFTHESGSPSYVVPGYFAADGNAANTSAESGTQWLAHLSPDKTGKWNYQVSFVQGPQVAVKNDESGRAVFPYNGESGVFTVSASDKKGGDFRAKGRLEYVGKHHLRFAGNGEYFLKAGPDSPETLLAYADFDNTVTCNAPLKTFNSHIRDWKKGDPTWKDGKGKGLIGALNYLAAKGLNTFSFLTYNAGGDGDNVWPFVERNDKLHYDCSKLDQWQIVFDHAQKLGLYLHFKLQETENDDNHHRDDVVIPESMDGGKTGKERKLYLREMIARYSYLLALNWNLGEENTQSPQEQRKMAAYIKATDPYQHHRVIHTFPSQQTKVYTPLLGNQSALTGASLQNRWDDVHRLTLKWINESDKAGKPWVITNDEQGPADLGVPQDPGYAGTNGIATEKGESSKTYDLHDIRKFTLWGNIMAGGAGVEYYFGYSLPQNDLVAEDWRSRDQSWDYCRIALGFFKDNKIPFWNMSNADALIGNASHNNSKYCLAKPGEIYLVYLPQGGTTSLDMSEAKGTFKVSWFNPRTGGKPISGSVKKLKGGRIVQIGNPPAEATSDWLAIIR